MAATLTAETWNTETARLTLFSPAVPTADMVTSFWSTIAKGAAPETVVSKPAQGVHQVQGPYKDGQLVVGAQFGRLDFAYVIEAQPFSPTPVTVGPLGSSLDQILEGTRFLLGVDSLPIHRVALGCVLLRPVESRVEGYNALAPFLPSLKLDATNSSDLFYQINRPRPSKVLPDLQINRLSKWAVQAVTQLTTLIHGSGGVLFGATPNTSNQSFVVRLETDLSTAQQRQEELPRSDVPRVVDELKRLTVELAEKGDVA